jgi:hypothetical protein
VSTIIIRVLGVANQMPDWTQSLWLMEYDPNANGGRGHVRLTDNQGKARRFATMQEAMTCYRSVPKDHPRRTDGKPNRPLTGFHIEMITLEEEHLP